MEENNILFVRVKNPVELRRSVLETTKDAIEILQRHEKFREIREEKKQRIAELRDDIKEICRLVNKLKSFMPKTKIRIHENKPIEKIDKKIPRKIKKVEFVEKPKITELDKLEVELRDIESKLAHIE